MQVKDGALLVVWFSCGAASAVAAYETLKQYGSHADVRIVNNPVAEEDPDNRRFLLDVADWLGVSIESAVHPDFIAGSAVDVWRRERYMSGIAGAPCTKFLKKGARQAWEAEHQPDWHVLGFTADERKRYDRFVLTEKENVLPVLIDARLTKQDCMNRLQAAGLDPPRVYREGYPNANCIGCVKATSPTYWNLVRQTRPAVFRNRARLSRKLGVRLVRYKGERIYLDELPTDAVGAPLKSMQLDCGIFCEEGTE